MDEHVKALQDQLSSDASDLSARTAAVSPLLAAGRFDDIVECFDSWASSCDSPTLLEETWWNLAEQLEEAAEQSEDPVRSAECLYAAGEILNQRLGRKDRAMLDFQKSFRTHSGMTLALEAAREIYRDQGSHHMVARLLQLEIKVTTSPYKGAALYSDLGRTYAEHLDKADEAVVAYEQALKLVPDAPEVQQALAYLSSLDENWRAIVEQYEREAAAASDNTLAASLYLRIAETLKEHAPEDEGLDAALRQCIQRDPTNAAALAMLASRADSEVDPATRRSLLNTRLESASSRDDKVSALMDLARAAAAEDDTESALIHYEDALDVDPGLPEALRYVKDLRGAGGEWDVVVQRYDHALKLLRRGPEEVRLLVELATIHWKELDDLEAAEKLFRRIKLNDSRNTAMLDFYKAFYQAQQDWRKLLTTLTTTQQLQQDVDSKILIGFDMAEVAETQLGNLDKAIDVWKAIRRLDADNDTARVALKRLFQETRKWNALLEFLKAEIASLGQDEVGQKVALYQEMVAIYRDHLRLDVMVINTYNAMLQVDPGHEEALEALASRYEKANRWSDLIGILQRRADRSQDATEQIGLLHRIAGIWMDRLSNSGKAVAPLERILEIDAGDEDAVQRLKQLFSSRRDWRKLLGVLRKEVELLDGDQRAALLEEMAELTTRRLNLPEEAIEIWERRLDEAPGELPTAHVFTALEGLYQRTRRWDSMAELLDRQLLHQEGDDEARLSLLLRRAELLDKKLSRLDEAVACLREAWSVAPSRDDIRRNLTEMYRRQGNWSELETLFLEGGDRAALLDVLERTAAEFSDPSDRIRTWSRAVEIATDLGDPVRLTRAREKLLELEPANTDIARDLIPIYEEERRWTALVRMYEVLLEAEDAPEERLELMRCIWTTYESRMGDAQGAFRWCGRAFQESQSDPIAADLERLAERTNSWEDLVILARDVVDRIEDSNRQVQFYLRMGAICMNRLAWIDDALTYYSNALVGAPQNIEAIDALQGLYARQESWDDLASILDRKIDLCADEEQRVRLLFQLAEVLSVRLARPAESVGAYTRILDIDGGNKAALLGLERIYGAEGKVLELGAVLERQLELAEDDETRIERLIRLGRLHEGELDDVARATEIYREVLELRPSHEQAVERLETLLDAGRQEITCAVLLEPIYRRREQWRELARVLEISLESSEDVGSRIDQLTQVANLAHEHLGEPQRAFDALLQALQLSPEDHGLWNKLEELASELGTWEDLAGAFGRAVDEGGLLGEDHVALALRVADIHEQRLGEVEDAAAAYEQVLQLDPDCHQAVTALEGLYTRTERWSDLVKTLERKALITTGEGERKDIFLVICDLWEEVLEDLDRAAETYHQVLSLDPSDITALAALERIYTGLGRHPELADVLRSRMHAEPSPDEANHARFRLACVLDEQLADAEQAVEIYREVLEQGPYVEAIRRLEGLLDGQRDDVIDSNAFQRRVTEVLEPAYDAAGAWEKLVRIFGLRAELSDEPSERAELWRRCAELHQQRAQDLSAAFDYLSRAFKEQPDDDELQASLEALSRERGDWEAYLQTLAEASDRSDEPDRRMAILRRSAEVASQELGDAQQAEPIYRKILEQEPSDTHTLHALEQLLRVQERHREVLEVLEQQLGLADDEANSLSILYSMASIEEQELQDQPATVATLRRVLDLRPDEDQALASLERLLTESEQWEELIPVLSTRAELSSEAEARRAALARIATIQEQQLEDVNEAIACWAAILDLSPGDEVAKRQLARIYEGADQWVDLLDILGLQLESAEDDDTRCSLNFRMGEIIGERLEDVERALESFQAALQIASDHTGARRAVESQLQSEDFGARAAEILAPLYERLGEIEPLVSTLEILRKTADGPEARAAILARMADLRESRLGDASGAYDALRDAFSEDHASSEIREGMLRLARSLGRLEELLDVLQEAAADELDGEVLRDLRLMVARIRDKELEDKEAARADYEQVLDLEPDNGEALDALQRIFSESGQGQELLEVLRNKCEVADEASTRAGLLLDIAKLQRESLDDLDGSISSYREVLDIDPVQQQAIDGLASLFESEARWSDLEELRLRQLDATADPSQQASLAYLLGRLRAEQLDDPLGAVESWTLALANTPSHEPTVEAVEAMFASGIERSRVAALLEPIYRERSAWAELVEVLNARHDGADDPLLRCELATEIARIQESTLFDDLSAYESLLKAYPDNPEDEELRANLERLANQVDGFEALATALNLGLPDINDPDIRLSVLRLTARVCDERLQDYQRSLEHWQQILDMEPDDFGAIDALERLFTRLEQWEGLVGLYEHKADQSQEPADRIQISVKICNLREEVLDQPDLAVETYRRILDMEPSTAAARQGLERLLHQLERWPDLVDFLSSQVDAAESAEQATALRHRLARLYEERLNERMAAIELLSDSLAASPADQPTLSSLEELLAAARQVADEDDGSRALLCDILEPHYREAEAWAPLVGVYEARVQDAADDGARVELLQGLAQLKESELEDPEGAFSDYRRAYALAYGDLELQDHVERLGAALDAWDRVVDTYLAGIEEILDPEAAGAVLQRLGVIFEERLGHHENSIEVYRRLMLIDANHQGALDALERLYGNTQQYPMLVEVLHHKALIADDVLERKELLYRICEVWEEVVGDRGKAIETYRAIRELDPDDIATLESLERLYSTAEDWLALADLQRERAEITVDETERIESLSRMARLHEHQLNDPDAAIEAYRSILDIQAGNEAAVVALEVLYERNERWSDLLDAIEWAFGSAEDEDNMNRLQLRMGVLLRDQLSDAPRAVEMFRAILERSPGHPAAMDAMESVLDDEICGATAAEVLEPAYEAAGQWQSLASALHKRLTGSSDPDVRVEILRRLAGLSSEHLNDRAAAVGYLGEALRLDPREDALVLELDVLSRELGLLEQAATLYDDIRTSAMDSEIERSYALRLGKLLDQDLGRPGAAIACYQQVLESDPVDTEALGSLDRLYSETERWTDLGSVLERRAEMADPSERVAMMLRLGQLQIGSFDDSYSALQTYRRILEEDPEQADALDALEALGHRNECKEEVIELLEPIYEQGAQWSRLLSLLDRKLDIVLDPIDQSAILFRAGSLCEQELNQPDEAFERYAKSLSTHPGDGSAVTALERLAGILERWATLAPLFVSVAERADDPETMRDLRAKAARIFQDQLGESAAAEGSYLAILEALPDDPVALEALEAHYFQTGNHQALVDIAWRRAEGLYDLDARKTIYREIADIAATHLDDDAVAAKALNRLLSLDETDGPALDAVEALYLRSDNSRELARILELRVGRTLDGDALFDLHERLGGLYVALSERHVALDHYRSALDLRPDAEKVLATLQSLYEAEGRVDDVQDILIRRVSAADTPGQRAPLLLQLAKIADEELGDPGSAIDYLRQLRSDDPENGQVLQELSRIFRSEEQWHDLVEVLRDQAAMVDEVEIKRSLLLQISALAQEQLGDAELARDSLNHVLDADPSNSEALSVLYRIHQDDERWDECLEILDRQTELLGDADSQARAILLYRRGTLLADHLGAPEDAVDALANALEHDPLHLESQERLLEMYEARQNWPGMVQILRRRLTATESTESRIRVLKQLAAILQERLDDSSGAVTALREAAELNPSDLSITRPLVDAYVGAKAWDEALPLLNNLIDALRAGQKFKELHVFHHLRGVIAMETGDLAGATTEFETSHELDATYLPNLLALGTLYFRQDQWEASLRIFQTLLLHQGALDSEQQKADVFSYLGQIRVQLGDLRRARDMFHRALMLVPDHEATQRAMAAADIS